MYTYSVSMTFKRITAIIVTLDALRSRNAPLRRSEHLNILFLPQSFVTCEYSRYVALKGYINILNAGINSIKHNSL